MNNDNFSNSSVINSSSSTSFSEFKSAKVMRIYEPASFLIGEHFSSVSVSARNFTVEKRMIFEQSTPISAECMLIAAIFTQ